jgi:hypothetical protein
MATLNGAPIPPAPRAKLVPATTQSVSDWFTQGEAVHKLNMVKYTNYLKSTIVPNVTGQFAGPLYYYNRSKDATTRKINPDHSKNAVYYPYGI